MSSNDINYMILGKEIWDNKSDIQVVNQMILFLRRQINDQADNLIFDQVDNQVWTQVAIQIFNRVGIELNDQLYGTR